MAKSWYILQTASQFEKRVEQEIFLRLERGDYSNIVSDVHVPTEKLEVIRQGKKRIVERRIWPGYVMVEMDLPASGWKEILTDLRKIQGVSGVVGYDASKNEKPRPMSNEDSRKIIARDSNEIKGSSQYLYQDFSIGQDVKIMGGSFKDFQGKLEEIDYNHKRVKVAVHILGRPTPVDIEFENIEKI